MRNEGKGNVIDGRGRVPGAWRGAWLVMLVALLAATAAQADRGVRVGYYDYPPLVSQDTRTGRPVGLFVEIVEYVAARHNWRLEWVEADWQHNLELLEAGQIDLVVAMGQNATREAQFDLSREAVISSWSQLYTRRDGRVNTVLDLDHKLVVGLRGDIYFTSLKELAAGFAVEPRWLEVASVGEVFEVLKRGGADAAVCERIAAATYEPRYDVVRSPVIFHPQAMAFATTKGRNPDLLAALDEYVALQRGDPQSHYQRAIGHWLGATEHLVVPRRLLWGLGLTALACLVALANSLLLRRQVASRTAEVRQQVDLLTREIEVRQRAEDALSHSEAKYRAIVEHATEGVFQTTAEGRLLSANQALATTLGYESPGALLAAATDVGRQFYALAADRERFLSVLSERGRVEGFECEAVRRDGAPMWLSINARSVCDEAGNLLFIEGSTRVVTARKLAEQALAREAARLRALLETSTDGIVILDARGNVVECNEAWQRHLGCSHAAALVMNLSQWNQDHDPAALADRLATTMTTPLRFEAVHRRVDDSTVAVEINAAPLTLDGRPLACFSVRDISERRRAEQRLRRQMAFDGLVTRLLARCAGSSGAQIEPQIEIALAELTAYFEADMAVVVAIALEERTWSARLHWQPPGAPDLAWRYQGRPMGTLPWSEARILDGEPVVIPSLEALPPAAARDREAYAADGLKSMVSTPMRGPAGRVVGALCVHWYREERTCAPEDIARLGLLADAIANLLERRNAEEAVLRRNRELALLNRIMTAATTASDPRAVLEVACGELAVAFEVPYATGGLLSEDKTWMATVAERRPAGLPSSLGRVRHLAGNPLAEELLSVRNPLVLRVDDTNPARAALIRASSQPEAASLLLLPLAVGGDLLGTLLLGSDDVDRWGADESELAWRVAGQVASAVSRAKLAETRRRLTTAIEQSPESVVITDAEGHVRYVNPAFERVTGFAEAEALGRSLRELDASSEDGAALHEAMWRAIGQGEVWHGRLSSRRKDGSAFTEDAVMAPVRDEDGAIDGYIAVKRDVTDELRREERYREAQKMDTIGRLAGGIAHDFNNILTAILNHAEFAQMTIPADHTAAEDLAGICDGVERAAALVRQLLTFARRQVSEPRVLDLNAVIADLALMLERLVGEDIRFQIEAAAALAAVRADPGQIEQVLVNLVVNARDAMPSGGTLTVATANATVSDGSLDHPGVPPGRYAVLRVSDTGEGIGDDVRGRIFEPFFTTKEVGRGTGLGLATCYGIAQQHGGCITVASQAGHGSTFGVYLPMVAEPAPLAVQSAEPGPAPLGHETILLVEDETALRLATARSLRSLQYHVLEAADGAAALTLAAGFGERIDLLLSDVIMPELRGPELATALLAQRPELRVLFISGYAGDRLSAEGISGLGAPLLPKPFTLQQLAGRVREVLDRPPT